MTGNPLTRRGSIVQWSALLPAALAAAALGCSDAGNGAPGGTAGGTGGAGISGAGGSSAGSGTSGSGGSTSAGGSGPSGGQSGSGAPNGGASGSAGSAGSAGVAGSSGAAGGGGVDAGVTPVDAGVTAVDAGGGRDAAVVRDAGGVINDAIVAGIDPSGSDLSGGPAADATARMKCTGTSPIHCAFGGPPGNYEVAFAIGGAAAARTGVYTECHRRLLPEVATAAGVTKRFAFTIDVRQPEGEPVRPDQSSLPADAPERGTPGLDLYFDGAAPQLASIGYAPATQLTVLYLAGDSTVTDQFDYPTFAGWGQELAQHFHLGLSVANYADSGESSASVLGNSKLFPEVMRLAKPNDYVLIQVGHNDKTITAADFHANITTMVTQAKARSVIPVLVTPIARADFSGNTVNPQHIHTAGGASVNLPEIIRTVAREQSVPLIDLTATTTTWLTSVGPSGWQAFHAPGDGTHTNAAGADINAAMVRDAIARLALQPLVALLR